MRRSDSSRQEQPEHAVAPGRRGLASDGRRPTGELAADGVVAMARSGHWIELAASGDELGLHDTAKAADGVMLGLVADEPLEDVEARLRAAGFPPAGEIIDQQ
jgi:hypothetical protein